MPLEPRENGKSRRITRYRLEFPTMPSLQATPSMIDIYQEQYHHDVAVIFFRRTPETLFRDLPTGLPVKITIHQHRTKKEWVGYVTHTDKKVQGSLEHPMSIHCVGASYPLKETATRTFTQMTIPEVAGIIAKEFGLQIIADSHPVRFPQLTMAGHSYWEWLVEQAKKIGFSVRVDGTTLYFEKFDRAVGRGSSSAPLLFFNGTYLPPRSRHIDRTLHMFHVLKGDNIETGMVKRATKVIAGIDPVLGSKESNSVAPSAVGDALRSSPADVLFAEYRTDQVAQSASTAAELAKGAASMARFNIPAKVKCIGDLRIGPFVPIQVAGTGEKTDGLWIGQKIRHNIRQNGEYDIEATILTDGTGQNNAASSRVVSTDQRGTVDVVDALATGGRLGTRAVSNLSSQGPRITTRDVGFNKDRARWKAGGVNNG